MQLLTRLRFCLSYLRDNKFKRNFQDIPNPICNCAENIESSCYYLLHWSFYTSDRLVLLNVIQGIDNSIFELTDCNAVEVILYGRKVLDISSNINVVNATINFLLETKRFDKRLFESKNQLNHGLFYFHFLSLTFLVYLLFSLIYFIVSFYFFPDIPNR